MTSVALLSVACSGHASGPPEIVVDRTTCSHCSMLVSEPLYAAAYQAQGRDVRVFDDIGCLLEAVRGESASPITIWVQDAAGGGWLDAKDAVFVSSPHIRTPMAGGVLGYPDVASAEKAAAAHAGELVRSFRDLMTRKGDAE